MHQIGIIFYVYKLGQSYQQIGIILNYIFVLRMFVTLWRHNWPTSFPSIVRKCQPIIPGHYHEDADFYEGDLANNWTMQKKICNIYSIIYLQHWYGQCTLIQSSHNLVKLPFVCLICGNAWQIAMVISFDVLQPSIRTIISKDSYI